MFQIGWVCYGLLIVSRPVTAWNLIAVVINLLSVAAYLRFARRMASGSGFDLVDDTRHRHDGSNGGI